ncbi:hypothetical protein [Brevibacillus laterosporus]|uniref:hypothetical protein n=1 Tax=Brevibacillus laterosporus TaxID=1465 RepID=UPI0024059EBF|nr:hypothetical protein [Brevibacillus laterosporus]
MMQSEAEGTKVKMPVRNVCQLEASNANTFLKKDGLVLQWKGYQTHNPKRL